MAQQLPKEDNNVKYFLGLFQERENLSGQNHVKSKSEAEDSVPPAGGKSKSSVKLPGG